MFSHGRLRLRLALLDERRLKGHVIRNSWCAVFLYWRFRQCANQRRLGAMGRESGPVVLFVTDSCWFVGLLAAVGTFDQNSPSVFYRLAGSGLGWSFGGRRAAFRYW